MPFKFWKKEKAAKEEGEGKEAEKEEAEAAEEEKKEGKEQAPAKAPPPKPAAPAKPAPEAEKTIAGVHAALVDLGLTIPGTREIFTKRVAAFPGGTEAFLALHASEPYKAATRVLGDWLGLHAGEDFDPEKLLADVNPRLSSFGLKLEMQDLTWLDQELGLRKARLRLAGQEKVVRFKDARDFMKGTNDLLAGKRIAFLELETWSEGFAFLLVKDPRWPKLAETELVIVKDPQTALGGECGECGAKVGKYWNDCLACGAVFS